VAAALKQVARRRALTSVLAGRASRYELAPMRRAKCGLIVDTAAAAAAAAAPHSNFARRHVVFVV